MSETNLMVVADLPWRCIHDQTERQDETWYLDIDGVHVWVKNYTRSFDTWNGWRIGRGGSPLINLNDKQPFESKEAAMEAAYRVAVKTAVDHVDEFTTKLATAQATLREVVLPI